MATHPSIAAAAPRSSAWSFASGMAAAREPELLPRAFFESLLRSGSRAEARAILGKSSYRPLFPDDPSLDSASSRIAGLAGAARAEILKLCPPHPLENFFGLPGRFRTFRTLFGQMARQGGSRAADLEGLFTVLAADPLLAEALVEHRACLHRNHPPQAAGAMERSLFLDSAACSLMLIVSRLAPEELVRRYMRDRSLLSAWAAILRSRWNGVPAETVRDWFIYDNGRELAAAVLAAEQDPKAVIAWRLSVSASAVMDRLEPARIRADIDSAAAEALRDAVLACRLVASGAERVLAYLVAVEAELVNLELCLTAVANGIDPDVTLSRLRREYA